MGDTVDSVRRAARQRLRNKLADWAQAPDQGVVSFPIRGFDAAAFNAGQYDDTVAELGEWDRYTGPGEVETARRRWAFRDHVTVPVRIRFAQVAEVAAFAGESALWAQAEGRIGELRAQWPGTKLTPGLLRETLELPDDDWQVVLATLDWAETNDPTGLFVRQLPVPGADTKWVQKHWPLIVRLTRCGARLNPEPLGELRDIEPMTFVRLLDDRLRSQAGGLGTFSAAPSELAALAVTPDTVIICENLANGRAFTDRSGTAVLAGKGNDIVSYAGIPWVRAARVVYWGDIDTYGYQILDRLRGIMPAESILMDAATLHRNRGAWVEEKYPTGVALTRLEGDERQVYADLVAGRYGRGVRLEQERILWGQVTAALERL